MRTAQSHCPMLVRWGERDQHLLLSHARGLQQITVGSQLRVVPTGEHWMALDELAAAIREFVASS